MDQGDCDTVLGLRMLLNANPWKFERSYWIWVLTCRSVWCTPRLCCFLLLPSCSRRLDCFFDSDLPHLQFLCRVASHLFTFHQATAWRSTRCHAWHFLQLWLSGSTFDVLSLNPYRWCRFFNFKSRYNRRYSWRLHGVLLIHDGCHWNLRWRQIRRGETFITFSLQAETGRVRGRWPLLRQGRRWCSSKPFQESCLAKRITRSRSVITEDHQH